jgi:hypothetical protein
VTAGEHTGVDLYATASALLTDATETAGRRCAGVRAGAGGALRWTMNRRQLGQWTAEWERVAQTWTSR